MLSALLLAAVVVSDGSGWVAHADAGRVSVSVDGINWTSVHRCGDPLRNDATDDHAAAHCPGVTLAWHGGSLYIGCPNDGLYRWSPGALEAVAVSESDAIAQPCVPTRRPGGEASSDVDALAMRSVFRDGRPPALPAPSIDIDDAIARSNKARWLPRLSVGLVGGTRSSFENDRWRRATSVEIWVWLSWDLNRNHDFNFGRIIN
jgi:hypothetical protein